MTEPARIRERIQLRCSPLLDMALSLLVIQDPDRFGGGPAWAYDALSRLPQANREQLRAVAARLDIFQVALDLEAGPPAPVPAMLQRLHPQDPDAAEALLAYWDAISPEVGARAGLLAESIQRELALLDQMDPLAYMCRFSDRISVAGDGEAIMLHWGQGMRVPLADLERILFVPSAFSPRRLMFYRLGPVQIFFYDPLYDRPTQIQEAPESLLLGFSALADATRMKLLRLIATQVLPAQEMAVNLGVNESTVSRHLKVLFEAGLVGRERQEGKFIYYGLQADRIDQLAIGLKRYLGRDVQ